ncbi:unnamed protein product [Paramecium sonneborni]|uniref:RING-type domain-containing protein n=1 Tax=Paramecium sonneborni TaxID=65129 RepID=A0A8S1KLL1_9CILI|nr:unnamed protein product [Paramecium sonneborni]
MSQINQQLLRSLLVDPENIDEHLLCGICHLLVCNPKECESCQQLFCLECIQDWMKRKKTCPYRCSENEIKLKEPHRYVKNTISHLNIKCSNEDCDKIIELGQIDHHVKECLYTTQNCQNEGCGEKIKNFKLEEHRQKCQFRKVICDQCLISYPLNQNHNCFKTLNQKIEDQNLIINQLKKMIEDQNSIINQLKQTVLQQQIDQQQIQQLQKLGRALQQQKDQTCENGHNLIWVQAIYRQQCSSCQQFNEIARFKCQQCNKIYCQKCKKACFKDQKCPAKHQLQYKSIASQTITCDFCSQRPFFKGEGVWSDRECDFDICVSCYNKEQS